MALEQIQNAFQVDGLEKVNPSESIPMRSTEPNSLELNDMFIFPTGTELFKDRINRQDPTSAAFYICAVQMVENVNGQLQAVDKFRKFYISNMWKRRRVCDEKGISTGQSLCTSGSAAEAFRGFKSIQEAIAGLANRVIKVTAYTPVYTLNFTTQKPEVQYIPTFEFVNQQSTASQPV